MDQEIHRDRHYSQLRIILVDTSSSQTRFVKGAIKQLARHSSRKAEIINFVGVECDAVGSKEEAHGRIEKREIYVTEDIDWLPQKDKWQNLKSIIMIKSERSLPGQSPSSEKRYYISSLPASALKVANAIRKHWRIENNLHRQLDVNFVEDDSVVNTGYAAENLATFRRLALNILGSGKGLLERRKKAGWNEEYLTEMVKKFFIKSF